MYIHAARVPIERKRWLARVGSPLGIATDTRAHVIARPRPTPHRYLDPRAGGYSSPRAAKARPGINRNVTAFQLRKNPPVVGGGHRHRKTPIAGPNNQPPHPTSFRPSRTASTMCRLKSQTPTVRLRSYPRTAGYSAGTDRGVPPRSSHSPGSSTAHGVPGPSRALNASPRYATPGRISHQVTVDQ